MDNQESGPVEAPSILDRIESTLTEESEPVAPTETEEQASAEPAAPVEDDEPNADDADGEDESSEPAESAADAEEDDAPLTFKVPGPDGEEIEVSEDDLRKGWMMQQDYTRKTQEVSEQRKEIAAERQKIEQERAEKLNALDALLEAQEQSVNWEELRELDPSEYMRQKELREQRREALEKGRKEQAEAHKAYMEQLRSEQMEKLTTLIPDMLDQSKAKDVAKAVKSTFAEYGFNDQEIGAIFDARMVHMGHELHRLKSELAEIKEKASKAKEQVQKAAPLTKPRTTAKADPDAQRTKRLKAAMRKGDRGAVAAYLEDRL